jgi:hypothetical protein
MNIRIISFIGILVLSLIVLARQKEDRMRFKRWFQNNKQFLMLLAILLIILSYLIPGLHEKIKEIRRNR